jgi:hypothetical protein
VIFSFPYQVTQNTLNKKLICGPFNSVGSVVIIDKIVNYLQENVGQVYSLVTFGPIVWGLLIYFFVLYQVSEAVRERWI